MSAIRQLALVLVAAFASLLLVAGVMAGVAAVDSASDNNALLDPASAAGVTFGYTMLLGAIPALLVGVPAYVILLRRNQARWFYVLALGVAPGLACLAMDTELGVLAIVCGAMVALSTHASMLSFVSLTRRSG